MGPIRCPETSVKVYHLTLCNNAEECRYQFCSSLTCKFNTSRKSHLVIENDSKCDIIRVLAADFKRIRFVRFEICTAVLRKIPSSEV
jgi:hypothetical protein